MFSIFTEIDLNKETQDLKLYLAFPNRKIICELYEKYGDSQIIKLGSLNELSFKLPFEIEKNHEFIRNPNIDKIKRRFLIKAQSGLTIEWYIIDEIIDNSDDNSKEIHAFSLGYELTDKKVIRYECTSYNATQVLHDALDKTVWNIGYIDSKFDVKYRSFNVSSKNVLDFVYEIANTFGALVVFNTTDRTINFYDLDNFGNNKGLYITYENYLNKLNRTENIDNIKTRLKVFGREGLSIHEVNITGQNYIEDYSFYMYPFQRDQNRNVLKHSAYGMSDELCHAILDYNELLISKQGEFKGFLSNKKSLQQTKTTKENELAILQDELTVILDNLDVAQANNLPTDDLLDQKQQKESEIILKQEEINDTNDQIITTNASINNLREDIKLENNFTSEQITELNLYVIEEEWSDENYIDAQDLYDEGVKKLNELKIGTPIIEVDIVNFLQIITEQRNWDKLNIGDIVNIKYEKFNIEIQAKIVEININYENGEIKLVISNIKDILNDKEKFLKMIQTSVSTSTTVSMDKFKWNGADARVNSVEAVLNNVWDDNKKQISMNVNESVDISRRGIIIKNPNEPNKMLIAQHGILALSQDGGNTWKHAIRPDMIIGEVIGGKLLVGQNLTIDASNNEGQKLMTVNEMGVKISGMALEITDGGLTKSNINSDLTAIWDLAETSVQIDNIPPTLTNLILEPIKISDKTTGDLKISIAKPNAIDLAGFNIWRNTENNSSTAMLIKSLSVTYEQCPSVLDFIDTDLINGQNYYYWVSVFDTQGNESNKIVTTPNGLQSIDNLIPSPPSNLVIKGGWGRIDLSWTAPEDKNIGKYKILINDVGNADINFAGVTPVYSNTTNYTDFDRINTNARYYRISAIDNVGNESTYISGSGNALLPSDNESPNPPTFGYISSDNNGGITITFNGSISTDALNYRIIRHTCTSEVKANDVNVEIAIIKHLDTGEHKYIDRNLDKNKYYYYQVYTIDNSGRTSTALNIDFGGKAILAIDNTPPTIPSNYNLNVQSKIGAICIDWSHWTVINSAVSYKIYRYDSDGTNEVLMGETLQFQFIDNSMSVVEAETYQYRISALDKWGNESLKSNSTGNVISLTPSTVSDTTPPTMGTFNDPIAQSNGSILLSWGNDFIDEGSGIGGYNIWRRIKLSSTPTYSEKELIQSIRNKNILEFYDITTVHNTTYVYTITCYDNAGNETEIENDLVNWKEVIAFDEIAPNAPTNIIVSGGLGSINVSWTPSIDNDIDYYIIQIGNSAFDFNPPQESYIIYGNSFTDYGRDSLNKRYYRIYSVDKAGNISETYLSGDGSAAIPGDGVAPNKPNTPNVESTYDGSIRITWTHDNPSGDIAKYRIYRINVGDPEFKDATGYGDEAAGYGEAGYAESYAVCVGEVDRDTLQYIDTGLKRNQEYKYSISAIDFSGLKSERTEDSIGIFATDLLAPIAPNVNATGDLGAIKLNWIEVDEVGVTYEIWRSKLGNWIDSEKIATVSGSIGELGVIKYGSYIDYDPPTNETVTWYYKLKAIDAWGNISDFGEEDNATSSINFQGLIDGKYVSEVVDFIDDISADNKLTPSEKQSLKIVWDAIITEKVIYISQGTIYELTTQLNNYIISLNALTNYLNNSNYSIWQNNISYTWGDNVVYNGELYNVFNPSINKNPEISGNYWDKFIPIVFQNLTSTTNINGTTLRSKFNDYYSKRSILFEAINNHAVHKDQIYNGVKIDTTNGLTVTKSDDKVRSIFNATEGIKIQRKTSGDWHTGTIIDAFYQDTDGNLIIKGKLEAGSIISDTNISGGTINIGDGNFSVNSSGVLSATGASIQGSIDCSSLSISGTDILDSLNKIKGDYLSENSVGASKLKVEELIVGENITMGPNATISWSKVTNQPSIPTKASDVGALPDTTVIPTIPGYIKSTYIDSARIESPEIIGGSIKSNTTIEVTTDLKVGNSIQLGTLDSGTQKFIYFNNSANIHNIAGGATGYTGIEINASAINLQTGTSDTVTLNNDPIATKNWVNQQHLVAVFG